MTEKLKDPRYQLRKLSDLFINDLFATPDADILAEAAQDASLKNAGERAKATYQRALLMTGQNKLKEARHAIDLARDNAKAGLDMNHMDIGRARKILEKLAANDPTFDIKVTLAARNLREITDAEVLSIIMDLKRLGALPADEIL
ncbi:MAG: hypothetical protein HOO85_09095 [Methylotenera sp.]|nr:hypothetical protein [Methylotenera sp.]